MKLNKLIHALIVEIDNECSIPRGELLIRLHELIKNGTDSPIIKKIFEQNDSTVTTAQALLNSISNWRLESVLDSYCRQRKKPKSIKQELESLVFGRYGNSISVKSLTELLQVLLKQNFKSSERLPDLVSQYLLEWTTEGRLIHLCHGNYMVVDEKNNFKVDWQLLRTRNGEPLQGKPKPYDFEEGASKLCGIIYRLRSTLTGFPLYIGKISKTRDVGLTTSLYCKFNENSKRNHTLKFLNNSDIQNDQFVTEFCTELEGYDFSNDQELSFAEHLLIGLWKPILNDI